MSAQTFRRSLNLLPWLLCPLLTLALYWRIIFLPFFWDDVVHFDFATSRTFLQIWTNVTGLGYYRPIVFTLYKLFFEHLPLGSTWLPHVFGLSLHALNGVLVGQLTRRLYLSASSASPRESWRADLTQAEIANVIAALFWVAYPFAALPLSHFAAVMHPLVTLFALSATLATLEYWPTRQRRWLVLAAGLTLLAPYIHEGGVMVGCLVAFVLLVSRWPLPRRDGWLLGLFPLLSLTFLPVWLAVPKTREGFVWQGWEAIYGAVSFFVQGPTYPLQLLSRPLIDRLGWWDIAAIWTVAALAFIIAAGVLLRQGQWRALAVGLSWGGVAMLPSVLILPIDYIVTSPRLLYYPGAGAAAMWAIVCVLVAARARHRVWRAALTTGLALMIAAPPMFFIEREVRLHILALPQLHELIAIAQEHPGERPLLINGLNYLNYRNAWYALGHEGVNVMAPYFSFDELLYVNSGARTSFTEASFLPIKTEPDGLIHSTLNEHIPWDWATLAAQVTAYDRVWLTTYSEAEIRVIEAGIVKNNEAARPASYLASFEDKVFLTGAQYHVADAEAVVTLEWKYLGPDPGATIFRHLFDCAGNVVGLGDGYALERMLPFTYLSPGAEARDVRHMPLDAISADGCYSLEVGLFRPDGSRVAALAPDGTAFENAVVTIR
jgi:hypothetical protein